MPSQSPNYKLTVRTREPLVPPDHAFEHGASQDFCEHEVFRLESGWPVLCGLRRSQHPTLPPDEARDQ